MTRPRADAQFVALLRGINVGGKNLLPMTKLAGIFVKEGCANVRTYIQSGNVVFASDPGVARGLGDALSGRILKECGLKVPVVIRSAREMRKVVAANPYVEADPQSLHVMFLAGAPSSKASKALDPDRSPGDSFTVVGGEIYLHLPNGVARTKLSNAYFDSALSTVSTGRNWATVQKLAEMAGAQAQ
jgi:uncharacterized protein (DUF1697 family)